MSIEHNAIAAILAALPILALSASSCSALQPTAGAAPEWIARLLPNTGPPGRGENRLRRLEASEVPMDGRTGGVAVAELRFPDLTGRDEVAQVRIFLPPALRDDPTVRRPLIHNAGYELDDASGIALAARGYVVSTPHAHPLNPLGRGVNLDRAVMHAVRALPFVDALRVSVQGGSAGGWMTLMMAADAFPLVWAMPDVPPIHWGYNAAYIGEQQGLAGPPPGSEQPAMPVLQVVGPIADQAHGLYGQPFEHPAYLAASPLAHVDTITAPTLVTFSTADMLVPIEQVGRSMVRNHDPKMFPAGFASALTDRFPGWKGQRTLLGAIPSRLRRVFTIPASANAARLNPDGSGQGPAQRVELPFAPDRVFSIVVLDEGPKEPQAGHMKYVWALDHEPFRAWAEKQGVRPEQLTRSKLERLMKRMVGEPWRPMIIRPAGSTGEINGVQLDYPEAERADVLIGLRAFAQDDACARQLARLYARLPARLKALGPRLGDGAAASVRDALDRIPVLPGP